jgi:hypothetical protein
MVKPDTRGLHQEVIETLGELQTDILVRITLIATREMDINWFIEEGSLNKGIAEINTPSVELEKQGEVNQKMYSRPHHNRSKGVFHWFLEVTTNTPTSL